MEGQTITLIEYQPFYYPLFPFNRIHLIHKIPQIVCAIFRFGRNFYVNIYATNFVKITRKFQNKFFFIKIAGYC